MKTASPNDWDNLAVAHALARIALGWNFLLHGLTRIYRMPDFVAGMSTRFAPESGSGGFLPLAWVQLALTAIPPCEIVLGLALIAGLMLRSALLGGWLLMLILIFGSSSLQDWQSVAFQMIYIGFFIYLMAARGHDRYSIDGLIRGRHRA